MIDHNKLFEMSENSLFVGNLSIHVNDSVLRKEFQSYGRLLKVEIKQAEKKGNHLFYGFVTFDCVDSARNALSLDGKKVYGRNWKVRWGSKAAKINIEKPEEDAEVHFSYRSQQMDWVICEETIRTMYSDFGAPVNDVAIHKYAIEQSTGIQSGSGFVHFSLDSAGIQASLAAVCALHNACIENIVVIDCDLSKKLRSYLESVPEWAEHLSRLPTASGVSGASGVSPGPVRCDSVASNATVSSLDSVKTSSTPSYGVGVAPGKTDKQSPSSKHGHNRRSLTGSCNSNSRGTPRVRVQPVHVQLPQPLPFLKLSPARTVHGRPQPQMRPEWEMQYWSQWVAPSGVPVVSPAAAAAAVFMHHPHAIPQQRVTQASQHLIPQLPPPQYAQGPFPHVFHPVPVPMMGQGQGQGQGQQQHVLVPHPQMHAHMYPHPQQMMILHHPMAFMPQWSPQHQHQHAVRLPLAVCTPSPQHHQQQQQQGNCITRDGSVSVAEGSVYSGTEMDQVPHPHPQQQQQQQQMQTPENAVYNGVPHGYDASQQCQPQQQPSPQWHNSHAGMQNDDYANGYHPMESYCGSSVSCDGSESGWHEQAHTYQPPQQQLWYQEQQHQQMHQQNQSSEEDAAPVCGPGLVVQPLQQEYVHARPGLPVPPPLDLSGVHSQHPQPQQLQLQHAQHFLHGALPSLSFHQQYYRPISNDSWTHTSTPNMHQRSHHQHHQYYHQPQHQHQPQQQQQYGNLHYNTPRVADGERGGAGASGSVSALSHSISDLSMDVTVARELGSTSVDGTAPQQQTITTGSTATEPLSQSTVICTQDIMDNVPPMSTSSAPTVTPPLPLSESAGSHIHTEHPVTIDARSDDTSREDYMSPSGYYYGDMGTPSVSSAVN